MSSSFPSQSTVPSPLTPQSKPTKNKTTLWIALAIILILIIGGIWVVMGKGGFLKSGTPGSQGLLPLSESKPETPAPSPISTTTSGLSGRACAEANRRTIGVMLAGDPINRPVSGFSSADMVVEMPVLVSDVTRLMALFQCGRPTEVGSVRSARHDYLFLAEGFDAILGHWGGSYHALNRIAAGEFQTINALVNPFNAYFRKSNLPAPYNGFTTYDRLWSALQQLGYRTTTNFKGYTFKDDPAVDTRPAGGKLTIAWPGAFRVHYEYDPTTNRYQRFWAGVKQVDGEDNKTLVAPSVVAIMRADNKLADGPGGYNEMGIEGQGVLEVYQDGSVIKGTWKKNPLEKKDPVHFLNDKGQEITFTRGQVWVTAVEPQIAVTWEPASAASTTVPR